MPVYTVHAPQSYGSDLRATDKLTFSWAKKTLAKYDGANIFTNDWLSTLFG